MTQIWIPDVDGREPEAITDARPVPVKIQEVKTPIPTHPIFYSTVDTESLTIDATAGGVQINPTLITNDTIRATIHLETAQIRWQLEEGLTLTAGGTEGSALLEVGDILTITGHDEVVNARFIRTGGTSGVGQVVLQRELLA